MITKSHRKSQDLRNLFSIRPHSYPNPINRVLKIVICGHSLDIFPGYKFTLRLKQQCPALTSFLISCPSFQWPVAHFLGHSVKLSLSVFKIYFTQIISSPCCFSHFFSLPRMETSIFFLAWSRMREGSISHQVIQSLPPLHPYPGFILVSATLFQPRQSTVTIRVSYLLSLSSLSFNSNNFKQHKLAF